RGPSRSVWRSRSVTQPRSAMRTSSRTATPRAGSPAPRSSTWVVMPLMRPPWDPAAVSGRAAEHPVQPQPHDLELFVRGGPELGLGIVHHAPAQPRQHLVGTLAGGADDENVAEPLLVRTVALGQRLDGRGRGGGHPRLLAPGEIGGRGEAAAQRFEIADA